MATNYLDVFQTMLTTVEREITISLWKINQTPEWFDGSFEQHFLRALNSRAESTYSKFKVEVRLAQCNATKAVAGNGQNRKYSRACNNSNRSGNSGPSIKAESIGEVIELSDDEDVGIIHKKGAREAHSAQSAHIGNQQMETTAGEELISNNRPISNGEFSAIALIADSNAETPTEVANTPSTSSGIGSKNNQSSTNVNRPALVVELRRCDEAKGSGGAKNEQKTAKDERKQLKCQICGYVSSRKDGLNQHMRIHTGERPHQCNKCSKSFGRLSTLRKHQLFHVKQYKFRCVGCARGFDKEIEKVRHDKVCEKRRYECYLCKIDPPDCDRTFASNTITNLKIHMRTHTGERPFRCEICMKRFGRKDCLKYHSNNVHGRTNR